MLKFKDDEARFPRILRYSRIQLGPRGKPFEAKMCKAGERGTHFKARCNGTETEWYSCITDNHKGRDFLEF